MCQSGTHQSHALHYAYMDSSAMLSLLLLVLVIIVMADISLVFRGGEDDLLGFFKFGIHIWILCCDEI